MNDSVRRTRRRGKPLRAKRPSPQSAPRSEERAPRITDPGTEDPLREAEQRFRTILNTSSDGIFLHDLDARKLALGNRSCLHMLGYTEEEFRKLSVADLHPDADLPFIYAQIEAFLHGGIPILHDIRFKRKDGGILFVDVSPDLVRLDGEPYMVVALKDITERKRAEETLAASERKYRSLVQNIPDVTWTTDREGRTLFISPNVKDVYGYSAEEICAGGDTWRGNIHPDDRLGVEQAFDELFTSQTPYDVEYRIRRKDGAWIWLHDRSVSTYEEEGRWFADGVFFDITERKRMEEELRRHTEHLEELVAARTAELQESETRYRGLYHTIADGIFVVGTEGRIEDVNESACVQLGYARTELIGLPLAAICARADFDLEALLDRLRTAGSLSYETTHRRKDGTLVPVELSVTPVEYRGRPAVLGVARDITERQRAEKALQFTQFAVDHTADAAFWMTEDARLFYVNEAACQALGYSRAELLGMTVYDIDPAFTEDRWRASWRKLKAEKNVVLETVHRTRDGRIYPVEIRANYVEFGGREYDCAFARDITERRRARETLQERDYLLSESQRIGHIGTWSVDLTAQTATWTPETYRLFGVSPDTFVPTADALIGLLHPEDRDAMREWMRAALAGEHPGPLQFRALLPDGSVRVLSGRGEMIRADDHRPVALMGTVQDVTERKQAEDALRQSEGRYRRLFEANLAGVYLTKPDGTILDFNDAMMRMLGYDSREEVFQHHSSDFYADPQFRQELIRRLQKDGIVPAREAVLRRKDGSLLYALGSAVLLLNEQTGEPYIQGAAIDITERKRAEEALRELNVTLEATVARRTEALRHTVHQLRELTLELSQAEDRERRRIADILHEDVQQTLAAAKFHLNLLSSGTCRADEGREVIEQVKHMLKDAIEKSRNLSHELSPAMYQIDLLEILGGVARHMRERYGLTVRVEAHSPVDSPSEPVKAFLYKVAQELLFNVVKHAGVSEARICVRRKGPWICLAVADRGEGFDPQRLEGAAGFGLLSIRERVQLLGGRMKIRSEPGRGSKLLITVPDREISGAAVP